MNTKPRILMIDDEPDILQVVGLLLKSEGFEVDLAESGAAALTMMESIHYDLVICDYLMPRMDGLTFLKKIRQKKDYTPFIFFSGNADNTHELKMVGLGALQLLPKSQLLNLKDVVEKTLQNSEKMKALDHSKNEDTEDFLKILHSAG